MKYFGDGGLTPADLSDRIERGNVRHIVAGASHIGKFAGFPENLTRIAVSGEATGWKRYEDSNRSAETFIPDGETRATDPLLLYFTSGTTSKPKLVRHNHQSYPAGHLSTFFWSGLQEGDRHWNISSPGWAKHAWSCFFAPWIAGATVVVYNYSRFQAAAILDALIQYRITTLCAPPTVWRMLVQEPLERYRVPLREALSAGEPLNPEIIERVQAAWGLTIRDGYGQTETTAMIGNTPGQPVKPGSMGRPLVGYDVVLLGPDGRPADDGEICLDLGRRPLGLTPGYAGEEIRSSEPVHDGFYHTGDIAHRDADGYLTFVGRTDDVFKSSDYRLSPFELESVLRFERPRLFRARIRFDTRCQKHLSSWQPVTFHHLKSLETSSAMPEKRWLRTSGSAGWNSPNCQKQFQEKSAASNCECVNSSFGQAGPARRWNFSKRIFRRHHEHGRTESSTELRFRRRHNATARLLNR